jgi:hypothetical protein
MNEALVQDNTSFRDDLNASGTNGLHFINPEEIGSDHNLDRAGKKGDSLLNNPSF